MATERELWRQYREFQKELEALKRDMERLAEVRRELAKLDAIDEDKQQLVCFLKLQSDPDGRAEKHTICVGEGMFFRPHLFPHDFYLLAYYVYLSI